MRCRVRQRFLLWLTVFLVYRGFIFFTSGLGQLELSHIALGLSGDVVCALFFAALPRLFVLYVAFGAFILTAYGFAELYQRPFTWDFVRLDSFSIWKENFISAIYEFRPKHFALLVVYCALVWLIARLARGEKTRWRWLIAGGVGVVITIVLQKPPVSLFLNPLTVSFSINKIKATRGPIISNDDLIPEGLSPNPLPYLQPIKLVRKKRNIILYFLESTPASALGKSVGGNEITPNLNRLRDHSLYFERHYANFPLSINAFYNAFCSAHALPDGAWISNVLPDFPVPCLSQILKKEGYRTIALHAGYLGYAKQKRFMQNRGFDAMLDAETIKHPPYDKGMGPWGAADERAILQPLKDFIEKDSSKPFLAVIFHFAPHHPYNKPDGFPDVVAATENLKNSQRRFYNSLHFADHAFGTIISGLESAGHMQNSILVAFGDHGEAFYEHKGNFNHPFFIYEENIHVPFFIVAPGLTPQRLSRVSSHVDILPTVLDLLDLQKHSSPLHVGRSLLQGGPQTLAHLQVFWQEEYSGVVDQRYKFIRKETGDEQLFDLQSDPHETQNLAGEKTDLASAYRELTLRAFAEKRAYYKKYANYELTRFKPSSQDK